MRRSSTETIRFLTLDETARLFRAIGPHRRDRALFLVAYRHGLRASEVGLLRVEDIDLKTLRRSEEHTSELQSLVALTVVNVRASKAAMPSSVGCWQPSCGARTARVLDP